MDRKLAHVEIIEAIFPIPNADKIEMVKILGWECVVKKNEFKVGEKVVYVEVDAIMPENLNMSFLEIENLGYVQYDFVAKLVRG